MNCKKCGSALAPNSAFCPACGEKVENEEMNNIFSTDESEVIETIEESSPNQIEVVEPVAPAQPVVQPEPVEPVAPAQPVAQLEPVEPVAPAQPVVQPEPVEPVAQPEPQVATQPQAPTPVQQVPNVNMATSMPAGTTSMKKKSSVPFIILIVVLILIIVGLAIFIGIKVIGGNKKEDSVAVEPSTTTSDTPSSVDTSNKIIVDRFEFTLPSGYVSTESKGITLVEDSTRSMTFSIEKVLNESITNYITYADQLITNLKQAGNNVSTYTVKESSGIQYLLVPIEGEEYPYYLYIAGINPNYIVLGVIAHLPDTTIDTTLVKVSTVLSSASGGTNTYAGTFTGGLPNKIDGKSNNFFKKAK